MPALDREYVYDPIGDRKSYIEGTAATKYYCSNELNQYDTIDDDSSACPVSNPDEALDYDEDGNLQTDGESMGASSGRTFTWDAENRLLSVAPTSPASGDKKVEFEYDYMNRRVSKKVSSYNGSSWSVDSHRRFIYYGWLLLVELDAEDSNAVLKKYTWGLDIASQRSPDREGAGSSIDAAAGISGLVACLDTQGTSSTGDDVSYAYFYDANGSVGQLVDTSDGSLDARYEYDAYGNVLVSLGSYASANAIRFSTKNHDDETDLLNYGERYKWRDRWLSRDPIWEIGGILLYEFAANAPVDHFDPDGRSVDCCGPDITYRLNQLLDLLAAKFRNASPATKEAVCMAQCVSVFEGFLAGKGIADWDIVELSKGASDAPFAIGRKDGCATGKCKGTVQMSGTCYLGSEVNYILLGRIFTLCSSSVQEWATKKVRRVQRTRFGPEDPTPPGTDEITYWVDSTGKTVCDFSCTAAAARAGGFRIGAKLVGGIPPGPAGPGSSACRQAWTMSGCSGQPVPVSCSSSCGTACCRLSYGGPLGGHMGPIRGSVP